MYICIYIYIHIYTQNIFKKNYFCNLKSRPLSRITSPTHYMKIGTEMPEPAVNPLKTVEGH